MNIDTLRTKYFLKQQHVPVQYFGAICVHIVLPLQYPPFPALYFRKREHLLYRTGTAHCRYYLEVGWGLAGSLIVSTFTLTVQQSLSNRTPHSHSTWAIETSSTSGSENWISSNNTLFYPFPEIARRGAELGGPPQGRAGAGGERGRLPDQHLRAGQGGGRGERRRPQRQIQEVGRRNET